MKVYIKNKAISLGGSSDVLDENQNPIYKVKGKVFSPTKVKKMYDMEGKLLYKIRNRWFNFFANKTYIFNAENTKVATIKKDKWSINTKYEIEDCVDDMQIEGKLFRRDSKIMRNGKQVGMITQEFTIIADCFCLEAEEAEVPFLTALVIGFDNIKDKIQKDK